MSSHHNNLSRMARRIARLVTFWQHGAQPIQARALLVDDEPNIRLTLGLVLQSAGFDVQTAESAQAAKAFLSETSFDLIVTDISLEQPLSGFDIIRLANLQPIKPATIAISGFQGRVAEWKENGADAGLEKPADVQELLSTIRRLLPDGESGNRRNAA